jgi:glycosyltransferase involved in cell wall biosynthesis
VRVIALLATYEEERFVGACIEHLAAHGLGVYLIDNESRDRTVAIAEGFSGRGVVGIESFPRRRGVYSWRPLLERKAELAATLDADWFVHVDADEIRLPPHSGTTLAAALAMADRAGYNAVDFLEFTFVPTLEHPDHDHPHYLETMRWYYPFRASAPDRLNAWKRQDGPVDLAGSGGHRVTFPGLRAYPEPFGMRHYLFLSVEHARRKFVERRYDPFEVAGGWHRRRAELRADDIRLLPEAALRKYVSDDLLDSASPFETHPLFEGSRVPEESARPRRHRELPIPRDATPSNGATM